MCPSSTPSPTGIEQPKPSGVPTYRLQCCSCEVPALLHPQWPSRELQTPPHSRPSPLTLALALALALTEVGRGCHVILPPATILRQPSTQTVSLGTGSGLGHCPHFLCWLPELGVGKATATGPTATSSSVTGRQGPDYRDMKSEPQQAL